MWLLAAPPELPMVAAFLINTLNFVPDLSAVFLSLYAAIGELTFSKKSL